MKTICLNLRESDFLVEQDDTYIVTFGMATVEQLRQIIRVRGYVYLNDIYEALRLNWSITGDNIPIINADQIEFDTERLVKDDEITVKVEIK